MSALRAHSAMSRIQPDEQAEEVIEVPADGGHAQPDEAVLGAQAGQFSWAAATSAMLRVHCALPGPDRGADAAANAGGSVNYAPVP